MYELDVKPEVDKIFKKLGKKNPKQLKLVYRKIMDIRKNPGHSYKFLRKPLEGFNRVHLGHFVLIFKINHVEGVIVVHYYDHHDGVYRWRPRVEE